MPSVTSLHPPGAVPSSRWQGTACSRFLAPSPGFHSSCLVFLANSCRMKLFNNIFRGLQAAGETEPRSSACLCRFAASGQPHGEAPPEILRDSLFLELQGWSWVRQPPAGVTTAGWQWCPLQNSGGNEAVVAQSPSRNKRGVCNQLQTMGSKKRIFGTSSFAF